MLKEFAQYSWDEIQESEYVFKSNVQKHVIQIKGSELGDTKDSILLAYYNVYTGTPMILIYRVDGEDLGPVEDIVGFKAVKETSRGADGEKSTETVYIEDAMHMALS